MQKIGAAVGREGAMGKGEEFGKSVGDYVSYTWEYKGTYKGHPIAVHLSSRDLKLYIDGESVDSVPPLRWLRKDVALVRGAIKEGESVHIVEIYGRSMFIRRPKIKICVDGERIAGDTF
jgi:hypothetical protein